jgi:hypothetical protein
MHFTNSLAQLYTRTSIMSGGSTPGGAAALQLESVL